MLKRMQNQVWFKFISQVLMILSVVVAAPLAFAVSIPLLCFMAPIALIAMPFMLGAFFGRGKEAMVASQPLRKLRPQLSH